MTDKSAIKQIEKELNIKIVKLDEIELTSLGYTLDRNGRIAGLGLLNCEIKSLNRIIAPLKDLTNLTTLYLDYNQLSDISPLKDLTNLTVLYLSDNQLSDISPLKGLTNLTALELGGNQLSDISPLKDLTNLTTLYLYENQISDISPLKDLTNLTALELGGNQLSDISPLKDLTNLTTLNLNSNQLSDISPLKGLTNLTRLFLRNNQFNDISPLKDMQNIMILDLEKNQLSDISPFKDLKKLNKLDLRGNPIEELPAWITDFNMIIKWEEGEWNDGTIYFHDNPLKIPPINIVKQGKEAITNYFEQLERQNKDTIYEAKLMLVGEPGAGKTTFMKLLFDRKSPVPDKKQKSTVGVEVRPNLEFSAGKKTPFKAHVWDFGGQQIQYMLHQFFLTPDCVYVLMAEKRRELANFDYWLNIINILGKNSPVITLFNEINIDAVSSFIYDEKKYKDLFSDLPLQRLDVNLGKLSDGRFDVAVNTVKQRLSGLEHIGKEVPAKWVDVRKELEERRRKKHIRIDEYFDICKSFGIEAEDDCMWILKYFHILGIVLHFCDDPNLCDTLFLDPNWTVDAVYSVLVDKEIEKKYGFIDRADIDKIWTEKGYDFEERAKLLQLMLKDNFELCYKLPGSKDSYIVPLLLAPKKPDYEWDDKNNLQFRFQYPFMPKGIVSRLIVRMHEYIDGKNVWKKGVVFIKNNATAQVIEQKTKKEGLRIIEIRLRGIPNSRKDLLTLIREEIKKIQNSSFPNLPYSEMVPCNCKECSSSIEPEFYDYKDLENLLNKTKNEIQCRKSGDMVNIISLIDAIGLKTTEIKKTRESMIEDKSTHITVSPEIHVKSHLEATLTATQQQTVTQEIKNIQGLFRNLKEDILAEAEIEIKDKKEKQRIKNELEKTEKAFTQLEKAASAGKKELDTGTKSRLAEFIDNLSDKDSRLNKALKLVSKGAKKVQDLARVYSKFAPYFGLPSVPPILLGKKS